MGLANALIQPTLFRAADAVPRADVAAGSAVLAMARQLGSSLGVALLVVVLGSIIPIVRSVLTVRLVTFLPLISRLQLPTAVLGTSPLIKLSAWSTKAKLVQRGEQRGADVNIEDADILVGGGRGLGAADGFKLAEELAEFGVRVCALCPGSTNTEFQKVAEQPDRVFRSAETAEKVARVGLEGLAAGKSSVISGVKNQLMMAGERLAPRRFVARMAAQMMKPEGK